MVLASQLTVGFLYVGCSGSARDFQDFVIIAFGGHESIIYRKVRDTLLHSDQSVTSVQLLSD